MCRDGLRRGAWRGRHATFPWSRCRLESRCQIVGGIFRKLPRGAILRRKPRGERREKRRSVLARLRAGGRRRKWAPRKKRWDDILRRFAPRGRGEGGRDRAQCSRRKIAGNTFRCRGRKRNRVSRRRTCGRPREGRGRDRRNCEK